MLKMNPLQLSVVLLGCVWVTGCTANGGQKSGAPEAAAVVAMKFHSFDPASVTIRAGETVRWENQSIIWHTVTTDPSLAKDASHAGVPAGAEVFDSGKVNSGQGYSRTFSVPGTYRYFCKPHETSGMVGQVVVQPSSGK
jgi:plastocyanin